MRPSTSVTILLISASLFSSPGYASESASAADLVGHMARLQYYSHKLGLAVSAKNQALQAFYVHEVEEVVERLADIDEVDGIPIGDLVETILEPKLENLEQAVKANDPAAADGAYDEMLHACNSCHQNANRPYIHIERQRENPYLQSFDPGR